MTEILCKWLNDELQISTRISPASFAKEFSSGYLLGEILHRYHLQDDFDKFSHSRTADSQLNNFIRLEPVLHLLGIPFDTSVAREIMTEKYGTATRILYQLYITLSNMDKANLTKIAMETFQPPAKAKLASIETEIFKQENPEDKRLKHVTPRQADLDLQALINRFHEHQQRMEQKTFREKFEEFERLQQDRQQERQNLINRTRMLQEKQIEMVAKINAAGLYIPEPPTNQTLKAIEAKKEARRKKEAEETIRAINSFEDKLKAKIPPSDESPDQDTLFTIEDGGPPTETVYKPSVLADNEYILRIRQRLQEDATAREEREKRRRKVLNDQLRASLSQEEAKRDQMMVQRLLRQSQQERRIVVQLLQVRREKDMLRQNRIFKEQQYKERREQDFLDALEREAEAAAQRRQEYAEQIRAEQELHNLMAMRRAEQRYHKHHSMCADVVLGMVDLASKVAEYRELTNDLVPAKLMSDWKLLFIKGQPLFEQTEPEEQELSPAKILEEERQLLLDEGDFLEYRSMTGEWQPPENCDIKEPPRDNPVIRHVIEKLFNIAHPPTPPPVAPELPSFPVRACVLGKVFSGKSTCLQRLALEHNVIILLPEILVTEAVEAFKSGEVETADEGIQADMSQEVLELADSQENLFISHKNSIHIGEREKETKEQIQPSEVTAVSVVNAPVSLPAAENSVSKQTELTEPLSKSEVQESEVKYTGPELTTRAKLGSKAMKSLKKGHPVDDQVMVDILIEAIRKVPDGAGWILDGFPQTYNQARLLEKGLSGCEAGQIEQTRREALLAQKSHLVPYGLPPVQTSLPPSGIDVVILFDVRDELCLKRAAGRYEQVQAVKSFHEEYNPPPDGSATGVRNMEKVQPVSDTYFDQEQIHTRITGFVNNWKKLEKWFVKYGTLKVVDASLEKEAVFLETEKILEDILARNEETEKAEVFLEEKKEEIEAPGGPPEAEPTEPQPEVPAPGGPEVHTPRSPSKTSTRAEISEAAHTDTSGHSKQSAGLVSDGSKHSKRSGSVQESADPPVEKTSDDKVVSEDQKHTSQEADVEFNVVITLTLGQSAIKKGGSHASKVHEPEPVTEPEQPPPPPPPQPGDEEWIFVDLDVDPELAKVLMALWEEIEAAYLRNLKTVFRNVRYEREDICRYLFQIRKDFWLYLKKPDCKQDYVDQWLQVYNEVTDDLRGDEDVKAELHQQVDDLVERLWNICDERKEQAENERKAIMRDGWFEDRFGLLTNHYLTVMQAEIDRFQDTVQLLKDYYRGLDRHVPDILNPSYQRLPLLELPFERPVKHEDTPAETGIFADDKGEKLSDKVDDTAKSRADSDPRYTPKGIKSPGAKKKQEEKETVFEDEEHRSGGIGHRIIIPLIAARENVRQETDKSSRVSGRESRDKLTERKGKDDLGRDRQLSEYDDKQLANGHTFASNAIIHIVQAEMAIKEAEEEAERNVDMERDKEKSKKPSGKGAKGGKKVASPPAKKIMKTKSPVGSHTEIIVHSEFSLEEIQRKLTRAKAREELYFAIQEEAKAASTRLDLIRLLASFVLLDLKQKVDNAFKSMNDWLGAKFLKEMESIDQMVLVMRNAIEQKEKLKYELILNQDSFMLDEDLKILRTPSPELPSSPVEEVIPDQFTVEQLHNLLGQLRIIAPDGIMAKKSFTELLESLVSVTHGMDILPDQWMQLSSAQIQEISNVLSYESDYVDWHHLMLALCQPVPAPSQAELLDCLKWFQKIDQTSSGTITREQWPWVKLWFQPAADTEQTYDRVGNLYKLLFEIFCDPSTPVVTMDYVSFLLYYSAAPHYHEGFLRALSVATGRHMPRLGPPFQQFESEAQKSQNSRFSAAELTVHKEENKSSTESLISSEIIPPEANDAEVSLEALYRVLHHSELLSGDSHRFNPVANTEDLRSIEKLTAVYQELNEDGSTDAIMYRVLIEHPLIQDVVMACKQFKALNLQPLLPKTSVEASPASVTAVPSYQLMDTNIY